MKKPVTNKIVAVFAAVMVGVAGLYLLSSRAAQTQNCMPDPSACGFPDIETTGLSNPSILTTVNGSVTLSTPGQVYQNKLVNGTINVTAANVTIRNVKLVYNDWYGIRAFSTESGGVQNLVVEDSEFNLSGNWATKGIAFDNYTLRRVFIHNGADCAHFGENVTIEDSLCVVGPDANNDAWPDNSTWCTATDDHRDGFQSDGGNNIVIRHNTVRNNCGETSAILMSSNTSPISNVTIQNNLLAGGGWTLYCNAGPDVANETVTGNRIARTWYPGGGYWGPLANCEDADVLNSNVWDDTGASVDGSPAPPPPPPTPPPSGTGTGDLNSDGTVNIFDLSILLANFNKSQSQSSNAKTDLNSDGTVNIFDLSILLSKWGTTGSANACALPNYPTASCTGVPAGTQLTNVPAQRTSGTGWQWVSADNHISVTGSSAVLEGLNVAGCIYINSNVSNVIVRKTKITTSSCGVTNDGTNALIEDVEIDCTNKGGATALAWQGYTARRVNAYHCDNTAWAEHNVTIEDSFLHDNINYDPVTDPHTDGIQIPGGATNITIRHSTIYGNYVNADDFGNSAITNPRVSDGGVTNVLIQDNLLAGGGYTIYCPQGGPGNNFRLIGNHFSTVYSPKVGGFGPTTECGDEINSGNVYHETGQPVPL